MAAARMHRYTVDPADVEAVPDHQTRAQLEVNLFGALAVTRAFLPRCANDEAAASSTSPVSWDASRRLLPS